MTAYRDHLRAHQETVNRLNVYPVPDGDTGTNMALTLESVVGALDGTGDMAGDTAGDMAHTCRAISRGSLMGARGNSGVILSQVLRGLTDVCAGLASVGPRDMAKALRAASEAADEAVSRPVEGTILTVVRAAADGAAQCAGHDKALADVLEAARLAASDALDRTPELLPVLKEAGVVDAGGLGFLLGLEALLHVVAGRPLPEPAPASSQPATSGHAAAPQGEAQEGEASDLRYEVMFFLEAPDGAVPGFRDAWADLGDSIVVAGGDGLWNCHIHTDRIGPAIEAALERGRPRDIRVTDLHEQVEEERWVRQAMSSGPEESPEETVEENAGPEVATAVVAVAAGEGLDAMFRSLGARAVVSGGQSMNPSTADLLAAVEAAPAQEVVLLPNNKNIVPVAEQVDGLTTKSVRVVGTRSVAEGLSALLAYDPEASARHNAEAMDEAAARVSWGEVTRAVRDSISEAGPIHEGDWLGISSRSIEVVAPSVVEAATGLLGTLAGTDHEIVTIIEGEGASGPDTEQITEWLRRHHPGLETEVHQGGQPLYPYLVSVE